MKLTWYADLPVRWLRQLVSDLLVLAWVVFWVWLAVNAHQQILKLAGPGEGLVSAGNGLRGTFGNAANSVKNVPLIGHGLADALGTGTGVGTSLLNAGNGEIAAAHSIAFWVTVLLVVAPLVPVLAVWLPVRLRYALRAGAVRQLARGSAESRELLALRALSGLSPRKLAALGPGLLSGWRGGDGEITGALVRAECARLGLRAP
jgi:hypothetical protein